MPRIKIEIDPEVLAKLRADSQDAIAAAFAAAAGESFAGRASQRRSVLYADHVESGTRRKNDRCWYEYVDDPTRPKVSPDPQYAQYVGADFSTGARRSGKAMNLEIIDAAQRAAAAGASPAEIGEMVKRWRAGQPVVIDGKAKGVDDAT